MADRSQRRQKLHPSATHKPFRPEPSSSLDGRRPPGWRGVWPSSHSDVMAVHQHHLRNKGALWGPYHTLPQHPQHYNYIRLLGWLSHINLALRNEAQCLVWGVRGAFPPSAAMVVTVFAACRSTNHFSGWTMAYWALPESSWWEELICRIYLWKICRI